MNRRDFLHPRRLAETAGQVIGALNELALPSEPHNSPEQSVLRFARSAMATTFEVVLPFATPYAVTIAEAALDQIDRLEDQLSVYRADSEMSLLNRDAAARAVPVEERLFALLELAERLTDATEGAFDITAGPLSKTWGFYRREGRVPTDTERTEALQHVGMRHVQLKPAERTVRFRRSGMEMNLGSIGKGYALDRVAESLREGWNLRSGLLHGGQSSVYAIGSEPGGNRGWAVSLRHPWDPECRLGMLRLCDQALGTSAATYQHLEFNNRKLGHILDPRTGWPAEGIASATVVADTAAEADALATAFFILGVEKAREYCKAHPRIGAVLLPADAAAPVVLGLGRDAIET